MTIWSAVKTTVCMGFLKQQIDLEFKAKADDKKQIQNKDRQQALLEALWVSRLVH
jgi:hypothetical protein